MKKFLLSAPLAIALLYVAFGMFLYIQQRSLLYFPRPSISHEFENFVLSNEGQNLNVIVVNPGNDRAVIYFGGNGEIVAATARKFTGVADATFYFMEYRGYGQSEGEPTEQGLYSDALALVDHADRLHGSVSVIGRSLGSGVATYVASKRDLASMVLVTPFDSVTSVAQGRFVIYPAELIVKDRFDSISRVADLKLPTLVLAAEHDRVVPGPHTITLFSQMNREVTEIVTLVGTGHNNIQSHGDYVPLIQRHILRKRN